jgi:hypothetical protein
MQGGGQAGHPELELAVDRSSEVQRWDFDPMLIEVEACLATISSRPQPGCVGGGPGGRPVHFRHRVVRLGPNLTEALTLGAGAGWGIPTPGLGQFLHHP